MGIKTNNYEVKKLGIVLPYAYALIKDLSVTGQKGVATFVVQSSRENCEKVLEGKMQAMEEVEIPFEINRNINDRITAYKKSKSENEKTKWNKETRRFEKIIIPMPFYGWQDDYI